MRVLKFVQMTLVIIALVGVSAAFVSAQTAILRARAFIPTDIESAKWRIDVLFDESITATIGKITITNLKTQSVIPVDRSTITQSGGVLSMSTVRDIDPINNKYILSIELITTENGAPKSIFLTKAVDVVDVDATKNHLEDAMAKGRDDAEVYVSGEMNGAHKKKTSFSTEIGLSLPEKKIGRNSFVKPLFFNLNASTDPDADPDSMEFGVSYRHRFLNTHGLPAMSFTTSAKIESERDFDNTNLISDSRLTFLPRAFPKGVENKLKIFFRPFVGLEVGKNLRSPLAAAEGSMVVRPLAGAKLRVNFPLNADEEREINWETVFTRRWPLKNELGYETNDDDELVLTQFGKSPRDFLKSKFSYGVARFLEVFIAYDWGELPPSYKLVDHRFRIGFAFKRKRIVK